jgi:PiT family inorganic phosphate transporter
MLALLLIAVVLLGYANGANDNFKGVATLYGSGALSYRTSLAVATLATLLGSLLALHLGSEIIAAISGSDVVPADAATDPRFFGAVGVGAAATVLLATRLGLPVSTTHALAGALLGASLAWTGLGVQLAQMALRVGVPLLVSPAAAIGLAATTYRAFRTAQRRFGVERETCVCAGREIVGASAGAGGVLASVAAVPRLRVGTAESCRAQYHDAVMGVRADTVLTSVHILSAAAVSFARGVNDTPKIVALLLASRGLGPEVGLAVIAVAIALGGLTAARRVAETMSHRITAMNQGQAFTGNLTTAVLVLVASRFGLPVSTTHVSCGALFGIGLVNRQVRWGTVGQILLAWVTTFPMGAMLAAGVVLAL